MLSNVYLRVCRTNFKSVLIFNHKRMNQKEKSDACNAIKKGLSKSTGYSNWREVKSIHGTRRQSLGSKTLAREANTELRRKSVGAKYKGWSSKGIQTNKTEVTQGGVCPARAPSKQQILFCSLQQTQSVHNQLHQCQREDQYIGVATGVLVNNLLLQIITNH